jgi:hypothetical protein
MDNILGDAMGDFEKTMKTINPQKKGQKKITFKEGGLHSSTGTKPGKKISASKHEAAKSGKLGKLAQKQELFYENVLKGRKG